MPLLRLAAGLLAGVACGPDNAHSDSSSSGTTGNQTESSSEGSTQGGSTGTSDPPRCEELRVHDGDLMVTGETDPDSLRCLRAVTGIIWVTGVAWADLTPLVDLETAGGLGVYENPSLRSLAGLENLKECGSIGLNDNPALESLTGLSGLTSVGGIGVSGNAKLTSLDGLGNLNGFTVAGSGLTLRNNAVLAGVEALGRASAWDTSAMERIRIESNPMLTDLGPLASALAGDLSNVDAEITYNPALANIAVLQGVTALKSLRIEGASGDDGELLHLENLGDLADLAEVEGDLFLAGTDQVTTLAGLAKLERVGGSLTIGTCGRGQVPALPSPNVALTSLAGLENLREVSGLVIDANSALEDITGIMPLLMADDDVGPVDIGGCPSIPREQLEEFCGAIGEPDLSRCYGCGPDDPPPEGP